MTPPVHVLKRRAEAADAGAFLQDVLSGLRRSPKQLPSKYFYDARGSALFELICGLPEYYLARAELAILREHAGNIAEVLGSDVVLMEYGSGSGIKTELLLSHLQQPAQYIPIELSSQVLAASVARLRLAIPGLMIVPICADFTDRLAPLKLVSRGRRTVVYFPGSTIGNFDEPGAIALMKTMRSEMGEGGAALIGVDLKKEPALIEAAYNDAAGITAAFTLNMLARFNRELGAAFDLNQFCHRAIYNREAGRIETYIVSLRNQDVRIGGCRVHFAAAETMLVEYSCKYSLDDFSRLANHAGLRVERIWSDAKSSFSVQYLLRSDMDR